MKRVSGLGSQALPSVLSFPVVFVNGLAKASNSMWIGFVEDRKPGGIANVLDEGLGLSRPQQAGTVGQF